LKIRLSDTFDNDRILQFIAEMGFNPRDTLTWNGLNMSAITAWDGSTLVGAIPFEPRLLQIDEERCIPTIHETVVAMRPELRGQGVGSKLQNAIFEMCPEGAELVTVFREEPESAAYRWYQKNGFAPAMHVDSWFSDASDRCTEPAEYELSCAADITDQQWRAIELLRLHELLKPGRIHRLLKFWLQVHPYRSRYSFHMVMQSTGSKLKRYALLGVGNMHSETTRVDVLEFCHCDGTPESSRELIQCIQACAARNDWKPVRWPLAQSDPLTDIAAAAGFQRQWGFDMLARPLTPSAAELLKVVASTQRWRYAAVDYA
jgi:GNAT superfamily N-acetyltransferase